MYFDKINLQISFINLNDNDNNHNDNDNNDSVNNQNNDINKDYGKEKLIRNIEEPKDAIDTIYEYEVKVDMNDIGEQDE
jgi:hypothetical protein